MHKDWSAMKWALYMWRLKCRVRYGLSLSESEAQRERHRLVLLHLGRA